MEYRVEAEPACAKVRSTGSIVPKMIQAADFIESAELLAFTRIVEAKSLSRAARDLRVPRATMSRRLARLEQRLGVRLLRRSTHSLSLTEAGETFYRHARIALESIAQAQSSVERGDSNALRGTLRVSAPPINDDSFFAMLTGFAKQHPDVRMQIDFSSRLVDLRREGYDVALRATDKIEPGLVARTLARHEIIAVASPSYLALHGRPKTAKDLKKHRCLTGFARGELPQTTWPMGKRAVHVEGVFSSNDPVMLAEAAVEGLGIAFLPRVLVSDSLESGALVQVLPSLLKRENRLAVVYTEKEFLPAHVRAFVDTTLQWAQTWSLVRVRRKPRA
jgi:DNA-binding transcriptional LysR family regulator